MSTYTQILYHIVYSTKYQKATLLSPDRQELFRYIAGILKEKQCHLYRINGVENHLHIATHLHPAVSLASVIKDIKLASSEYIKERFLFPHFGGWQNGYGAFTYSITEKDRLIHYVKDQEVHHARVTFREEYTELLTEHGIEFDEKYLF